MGYKKWGKEISFVNDPERTPRSGGVGFVTRSQGGEPSPFQGVGPSRPEADHSTFRATKPPDHRPSGFGTLQVMDVFEMS